jgi:cytidylate kinase
MVSGKNVRSESAKSIVICVGGMAGSGKSTLGRRLAEKYGLRYFSGGDALKALALSEGFKPREEGWWESGEGMKFLEKRSTDPRFDETVDKQLLQMAKKGNVVLDSWTMPWLFDGGFKIWLEASLENRARRIAGRDMIGFEEALRALRSKERRTREIYKKMYGFSLGADFAPFHFILDTDNLQVDEIFSILCMVVDSLVLGQKARVE